MNHLKIIFFLFCFFTLSILFPQKHQLYLGFDYSFNHTRQHINEPQSRLNKGKSFGVNARIKFNNNLSFQLGYYLHRHVYNNSMVIDDGLILKSEHRSTSFPLLIQYSLFNNKKVKFGPLASLEIFHTISENNVWKNEASTTPTGVWDNTYKVFSLGLFNEIKLKYNILFGYHLHVKYNHNPNNLLVKSRYQQGIGFYVLFSFLNPYQKTRSCFGF